MYPTILYHVFLFLPTVLFSAEVYKAGTTAYGNCSTTHVQTSNPLIVRPEGDSKRPILTRVIDVQTLGFEIHNLTIEDYYFNCFNGNVSDDKLLASKKIYVARKCNPLNYLSFTTFMLLSFRPKK